MNIKFHISRIIQSKNIKHGMLYTMFSFVNSGISFILLLILARFLTPYDYGQLNLFTTFVTLVNIIITLCTTSYISVSFFQKSKEKVKQIILIALGTTTVMLMIISLTLLLIPGFIEKSIGVPIKYLWLGILICYFQVFNSINLEIWRLEEKPISYGIYSVSFAICNFILTFWLIVGLKFGWEGRVYASWLLGILYFLISILFLIKRRYLVITKPSISLIKETFGYAIPLLPHTSFYWLKQGLDRYIINFFHDQTVVGYFSFAMNLAAIIGIVGTAFNATNSVYIYKKLAEGYRNNRDNLHKQIRVMTVVFLVISIGVIFFAFGLIYWVLPKYSGSGKYIIPLCMASFGQCIYLLWVNFLFFYKKTKRLMLITVTTASLQVILSLWLTRYTSIYTAYIAMFISFITALSVYITTKNVTNQILKSELEE